MSFRTLLISMCREASRSIYMLNFPSKSPLMPSAQHKGTNAHFQFIGLVFSGFVAMLQAIDELVSTLSHPVWLHCWDADFERAMQSHLISDMRLNCFSRNDHFCKLYLLVFIKHKNVKGVSEIATYHFQSQEPAPTIIQQWFYFKVFSWISFRKILVILIFWWLTNCMKKNFHMSLFFVNRFLKSYSVLEN